MSIRFASLGSGSKGNSTVFDDGTTRLLIDLGFSLKEALARLAKLNLSPEELDGILVTHEHADHTAGLDDIRPYFFRQGDIPIYGTRRVIENLTHRCGYIFKGEKKYPGAPAVKVQIISKDNDFIISNKRVIPIEVTHNRLSIMGYRIGGFSYLTDVKYIEDDQLEKLRDSDVLVLNALRVEPHPTHLNLEEALALVEKLKPKKAYFTHISHLLGFHDKVSKTLPKNVHLAYDNLQINCS